jgi:hypothetical protein
LQARIWLRSVAVSRRAALLSAALALALMAAGCGDESNAFKEDYNRAIRPLTERAGGAGESQFARLAARAERTARNLRRLEPPEDADKEFDELLAALDTAAADLRALARSVEERDPGTRREAIRELEDTVAKIQEAESAFQDAVGG